MHTSAQILATASLPIPTRAAIRTGTPVRRPVHWTFLWLGARAEIIAEFEGSDPGYLWIPTKPGRPRGGRPAVKPGLAPAAARTFHAAHRTLLSRMLGIPLRPGALRAAGQRSN